MRTPPINRIPTDNRLLPLQPEQRMVDTIPLQRPQKHNRTIWIPIQHEETKPKDLRPPRRVVDILRSKHGGPVGDFLVVLAVNTREDIGGSVELGLGEGLEDGVCSEKVVWVVVGYEDGFQWFVGNLRLYPVCSGQAIGLEERGVDEDGLAGADD